MLNRGLAGRRIKRGVASIDPETGSPRPAAPVVQDVLYVVWEPSIYRDSAVSGFEDFVRQNGGRIRIAAIDPPGTEVDDEFVDANDVHYRVVNVLRYPSHDEVLLVVK